jgi:hypothetical protein
MNLSRLALSKKYRRYLYPVKYKKTSEYTSIVDYVTTTLAPSSPHTYPIAEPNLGPSQHQ